MSDRVVRQRGGPAERNENKGPTVMISTLKDLQLVGLSTGSPPGPGLVMHSCWLIQVACHYLLVAPAGVAYS